MGSGIRGGGVLAVEGERRFMGEMRFMGRGC